MKLWIALFLFPLWSFADTPQFSPVGLVDYSAMAQAVEDFHARPDLKAVEDLVTISYDSLIGRPWGSAIFPEATQRLQKFKALFCGGSLDTSLCFLPGSITSGSDLSGLTQALADPRFSLFLQTRESLKKSPFSFDPWLPVFNSAEAPQLNFLLTAREKHRTVSSGIAWNMTLAPLTIREKEFVVISDIGNYASGFQGESAPAYLAFNQRGELLLNMDRIKEKAIQFGDRWKHAVKKWGRTLPTSIYDYEDTILLKSRKDKEAEFQAVEQELLARLVRMNSEAALEAKRRFAQAKANGDYAEEVYYHVSLKLFQEMLELQGEYFSMAKTQRLGLNPKRQIWEGLLWMQTHLDGRMVLFLVAQEAGIPKNDLLEQFVSPSIGLNYVFEVLKMALDLREYEGKDNYERYKKYFVNPEMFEPEFLRENSPEALALLNKYQVKSPELLPQTEQKEFWNLYLFNSQEKSIRMKCYYRAAFSLLSQIDEYDAKSMSLLIHQARIKEFLRQ